MKRYLLFLLIPLMFINCSSDNDDEVKPTQDYTSVVVVNETDDVTRRNCVVGYKQEDGTWLRIASLGDIVGKTQSKEIKVDYNKVNKVYLFMDLKGNGKEGDTKQIREAYPLEENTKNILVMPFNTGVITITDLEDNKQYPIE